MKVLCEIDYTEVENETGRMVPGVTATCSRCGDRQEAYGQTDRSVTRCFMLLKENCRNGEANFYDEGNVSNSSGSWATKPAPPAAARAPNAPTRPGPASRRAAQAPVVQTTGSIPRLIAENNFCVIKCATTGLSTEKDEVVQIGLVQIDKGRPKWRMSVNVRPTVPIPAKATEIHGLDLVRLHFAPLFGEIAAELIQFIGPRVLLGYGCTKFDVPLLTRQLNEAGVNVTSVDFLDVLLFERRFAQDQIGTCRESHGLEAAIARWGVADHASVTHDALNDAKAVWSVFVALASRFPELGDSDVNQARELQQAEKTLNELGLRSQWPSR